MLRLNHVAVDKIRSYLLKLLNGLYTLISLSYYIIVGPNIIFLWTTISVKQPKGKYRVYGNSSEEYTYIGSNY